MKKKSNAGRPTKMTEETLKKLREGFSNSLTDEECCLYAEISPKTLYTYCKENPEYLQYKEVLKRQPNIKAKSNWVAQIKDGNYQASKERLERKARDEFSLKTEQEITGKDGGPIIIDHLTDEQKRKMAEDYLRKSTK